MTKAPISMQDLRRSLYVKAKPEPSWRFWGLYVHVCKAETLREAYQMAKGNDGAPGIDRVTFEAIEESGVENFLVQIRDELVTNTYRPMQARKKEIPKDEGKKVRILSIPAIRDRVVQGALKLILEPIFEADFQAGSFGYRPKRTAHEAVARVARAIVEEAEPLAIAMHSLRLASIRPGETVAVIGAGPIGLLTIAALRAAQAGRIWAVEPLAHRRDLAREIGADAAIEPGEAAEEILSGTLQRGVDCAIDCAAGEHTTSQAIQLSRSAGRVALTGIHSIPLVSMDGSAMRRARSSPFSTCADRTTRRERHWNYSTRTPSGFDHCLPTPERSNTSMRPSQ
jgi:hypothetical protein